MNFTKNKKNNSGNPIIYDAQNLAFEKSLEYYKTINENINYEEWLREFNILDWEQEFNYETEKRENKIYHTIWDNLITNDDFVIIY